MPIYMLRNVISGRGAYWNQSQGLISISNNNSTWITFADKNVGATQVYNKGDTLTPANNGKLFQRGNNYGFSVDTAPTMSSTAKNLSSYSNSNYSSSTFINNYAGDSSYNHNLRGGTTNTYVARKGPCASGYHVPSVNDLHSLVTIFQARGLLGSSEGSAGGITSTGEVLYKILKSGNFYIQYYNNSTRSPGTQSFLDCTFISSDLRSGNYSLCLGLIMEVINGKMIYYIDNTNSYSLACYNGRPVRPFKNDPVVPTSSRTTLYEI